MPLIGCIADDFTGATDLASMFVRGGARTVQTIGVPQRPLELGEAEVLVVALKSRNLPPEEAVKQSLQALEWLQSQAAGSSTSSTARPSTPLPKAISARSAMRC